LIKLIHFSLKKVVNSPALLTVESISKVRSVFDLLDQQIIR